MNIHTRDLQVLPDLFDVGMSDPAMELLARTARVMRADPDYLRRDDDLIGAVFLSDELPVSLAEEAWARTLSQIDAAAALDQDAAARTGAQEPTSTELTTLPSPLRESALEALKHRAWRFGGLGIRRLVLMAENEAVAELLRVEPGRGAADHDHAGDELTLVLTGAYRDSEGLYGPGDISLARPGFSHAPRTEPGEVCYLLAVTYGEAKFSGVFGLLQRFIGFPWAPKSSMITAEHR